MVSVRHTPRASNHYSDVIMSMTASWTTSVSIGFSTIWSDADHTLKLLITGNCEGNPPVTGGFPSQRASNAENVSVWWHYHMQKALMSSWCKHSELSPSLFVFSWHHVFPLVISSFTPADILISTASRPLVLIKPHLTWLIMAHNIHINQICPSYRPSF